MPWSSSRPAYLSEQKGLAGEVMITEKTERSESDTSFNPNNLQIMTGLSGSQGEGIS